MSKLFTPIEIRSLKIRNRIFVSPMCQYSAVDGVPQSWHMVHLGARAVGGAGLVMVEATGVSPEGRISPSDTGIWNEQQVAAFKPITEFIRSQGAVPGIQLAHAGRKASVSEPWNGDASLKDGRSWTTVGPSAVAYNEKFATPKEMDKSDIDKVVHDYVEAATRALHAGFEVIEIHMAHGYLFHEFLSPISNKRTDEFGGSLENRMRFSLLVAEKVRAAFPKELPIFVRISASDWTEGGWDLPQSIILAKALKEKGIDLIDCSSGGNVSGAKIKAEANYQVPFAEGVRKEAGIMTGAVGMITEAHQAEAIIAEGKADVVFLARQLLRDPYWPLHAAKSLNVKMDWPKQYERAQH